ncbi:hypothetical protein [Paracoccus laeviglucosivorans]|uniref:Uncharacterized protein n=1 Tax=Paracoccus laeviglucosivorans TaxID=1197861 RepID=A0A521F0J9_9RHOB|nr:hypothetical protein [Paracoccus laeviglucosivorans]SMO88980.1 hypothetical protein SAMN06265221_116102 [Paracoccus laeviglucosivorans]
MFDADQIAQMFTRDGRYLCARWGRPVAPVIFGLADETLDIFRGVTRAALAHARHPIAETDPEMGANMMSFFVRDWDELAGVPDLGHLTGQDDLPARLAGQGADQYRIFRFDADGGIRACLSFVRIGGALADAHPAELAEGLVMRGLLTFAQDVPPSAGLAALIRAAYDPVMPIAATDPSHALRLSARLTAAGAR